MEYTPEQQAAAWAAYYAQQGYDTTAASSSSAAYAAPVQAAPPVVLYDPEVAMQGSAYMPGAIVQAPDHGVKKKAQGKRETVIRKAGGKVWEDQTLLEWDPGERLLRCRAATATTANCSCIVLLVSNH